MSSAFSGRQIVFQVQFFATWPACPNGQLFQDMWVIGLYWAAIQACNMSDILFNYLHHQNFNKKYIHLLRLYLWTNNLKNPIILSQKRWAQHQRSSSRDTCTGRDLIVPHFM